MQICCMSICGLRRKNSLSLFNIKSGNNDQIMHCFWADPIWRRAYKFYCDVIVFDTAYNTNRHGMIFASFIGANEHAQTVVFGCAFLSNESTESFVWLFEQFKEAIPGDDPKMIITCRDSAMEKAKSQAFPQSFHTFCSGTY